MKKCIYARCKKSIPDDASFCPYCGRKQVKDRSKKAHRRPKGTGSVYKMAGDRTRPYYAVYNGKSTGRTYATKGEAEAALDALISSTHPDLFAYTLEDAYQGWSEVAYRDMGYRSRRSYELAWKYVPEPLRKKAARDVRTDDFQAVVDEMQGKGMSDSSAAHVKNLYSKLCRWMMQRDLIQQNYATYVKVSATEHRPIDTFSVEEVSKINTLANGDPADRMVQTAMITMIFLFTGMRISELFKLPTDGIHLDSEPPYIQGGIKTEAGKNRIIPIHSRILPYVKYLHSNATGPLLISGYSGRKSTDGWRANDYKSMLASLGIAYKVPHNTRKTMATNAAQAGVDQVALIKLMGWTDINIGNKYYIAPDAAYLAAELDKLDGWNNKLDNS